MAKIPFSKLQTSVSISTKQCKFLDRSGNEVFYEVKSYLPYIEKIEVVNNIVNNSIDGNGFYNPLRVNMYSVLEFIYAYTNLNFTEKQKEDPFKLYDLLVSNKIFETVLDAVGSSEWDEIKNYVNTVITNIYTYRNSIYGELDATSSDYEGLELDAQNIRKALGDNSNLELLRDVMSKLG